MLVLGVGIDIGGTKLLGAVVRDDGTVLERARVDTPKDTEAISALVADLAGDLTTAAGSPGLPVGIGAAGLVDATGTVRYAPNVNWREYPLRDEMARRLEVPVTVENDANAAAWGEFRVGGGAQAKTTMIMLTVGTGVGGGLVVEGKLVRGVNGLGAEFGHIIVDEGGAACGCGNSGCLEVYASGTGIGRAAASALAEGVVPDGSPLRALTEVTGKSVMQVAQDGDETARAIVRRCGFWLGVGIASLVNALDPELVVLGGGAMQSGDLLLEPARAAAAERIVGRAHRRPVPIVRAQLGDDAGIIGAALLALDAAGLPLK